MPVWPLAVLSCLPARWSDGDQAFLRAFTESLSALPARGRRGALGGRTGHIGESVVEMLLDNIGYSMLQQFCGPSSGGHGADLIVASPAGEIAVVEVKATLRAGRWPRPSHGELNQLTPEWLDKPDNPAMIDLGLTSDDVWGMIAVVNFAECRWKVAVTTDFRQVHPIYDAAELAYLGRLTGRG
jgi:hypothetical protein